MILLNKKLQVFVSSTYEDLKEERQAAVEAILDAGHIPAGMELFKAGNRTQLETIYKWIDESDVYMLILGGRYGSIEPNSGKSYTHLEYDYAVNNNIPVFSIILSEQMLYLKAAKSDGNSVFEQDNNELYKTFKKQVMSKIVREIHNLESIPTPIYTTLTEFISDYNLSGWVKENVSFSQTNQKLIDENYQLLKEINKLTKENQNYKDSINNNTKLGNLTFNEVFSILKDETYTFNDDFFNINHLYKYNGVDLFLTLYPIFSFEVSKYDIDFIMPSEDSISLQSAISLFEVLGLCEMSISEDNYCFNITNNGKIFINKLKLNKYKILLKENSTTKDDLNKKIVQSFSKPHVNKIIYQ